MKKARSNQILKALKRCTEVSPELKRLTKKARRAADFLKAFVHEKRLLILCALAERERSVTELEILLSLSQFADRDMSRSSGPRY